MTPEQQKAYYAKNKADASKKEKDKDYEVFGSRGDAARKGMEEGKTNAIGDTYKKGEKVMKKMKKYEGGGDIESTQGENKAIGDDTRAKAMAAIAAGGQKDEEAVPKKAAVKLTPKAEAPAPKEKTSPVQQAKDVVSGKGASTPKSFSETGGSNKATNQKADLSGLGFKAPKLYDPLAKYEQTGPKRSEAAAPKKKASSSNVDYSVGNAMRSGGSVSSASKRADGIATKGKTRGKMC